MTPAKKLQVAPTQAEIETLVELDRSEATSLPEDGGWSEKIEDPKLWPSFWIDPEPKCVGVLSADRIRAYHYMVGRMIRPLQESRLNPASYDLTLGPRYVLDGKEETLDGKRRVLRIPPSSIAMVTSREVLLIPHWLVATFNLKSRYIFDGLLMGAGPQIDPGYMGVLTCPLHNISNKEIELEFCQPFAKLDFVKTTWGKSIDISSVSSEDQLYERSLTKELVGRGGQPAKLWPRDKNFRPPVSHMAGSEGAKSSLQSLEHSFSTLKEEFQQVERGVHTGQRIGAGYALAVFAILIGLATFFYGYTNERVDDVRKEAVAAERARHELRSGIRLAQARSAGQARSGRKAAAGR